jgi:hypothetical protein
MPLIWRGMGIIVPIIFLVTGFLYSWISGDPDKTLGNTTMLSWTSLIAGILLTVLGLGAHNMTTQDSEGNTKRSKHDFFYIPVFIWGLILCGFSIYFFVTKGSATPVEPAATEASPTTPPEAELPTSRTVNLYNPTNEALTYIVADDTKDGLVSRAEVAPKSFANIELEEATYLFSAYNGKKETVFTFPDKAFAADEAKYTMHKDDKGSFYQRIVKPGTKENDDYDQAWIVLDGKTSLLLVNVTSACYKDVTENELKKADWVSGIQEEYDGRDMIEPLYNQFMKDKMISVIAPGAKLPTTISKSDIVYLLVPFSGKGDKKAIVTQAVISARF